jgi:copper chaperone
MLLHVGASAGLRTTGDILMKLIVEGMTCGHCVRAITQAIGRIAPAAKVAVDLDARSVTIEGAVDAGAASAAIEEEGYTVTAIEAGGGAVEAKAANCCGGCGHA